jgi:hypothetical protein
VLKHNVWQAVGPDRQTDGNGVFVLKLHFRRGALLRVFSPTQKRFSLQLRLR